MDDDERLEGEKQGSGEVGEGCDAVVCDDGKGGDASGGEIGAGGGECDAVDVEGVWCDRRYSSDFISRLD